jgi:hypothetical protein
MGQGTFQQVARRLTACALIYEMRFKIKPASITDPQNAAQTLLLDEHTYENDDTCEYSFLSCEACNTFTHLHDDSPIQNMFQDGAERLRS